MRELVELLIEYFEVDGVFLAVLLDLMPQTDALTQEVSKVGVPHAGLALMVVALVFSAHAMLQKSFSQKLNLNKHQ